MTTAQQPEPTGDANDSGADPEAAGPYCCADGEPLIRKGDGCVCVEPRPWRFKRAAKYGWAASLTLWFLIGFVGATAQRSPEFARFLHAATELIEMVNPSETIPPPHGGMGPGLYGR
jgi:hypothetical protein